MSKFHVLFIDWDWTNMKNEYFVVIGTDTIPYDDRIANRFDFYSDDIQDFGIRK